MLVFLRVGPAREELVQLDQQLQVGVVALNRRPLTVLDAATSLDVDTHFVCPCKELRGGKRCVATRVGCRIRVRDFPTSKKFRKTLEK